MFGYVLPEKPEMKIKEYELFRAYYCGVCKSMGKRYGQLPRVSLTYDAAFLALLLSSLYDDKLDVRMERCLVHPVRKRHAVRENVLIDYASDINIILAYYKLKDDWQDERSPLAAAGLLALSPAFSKLSGKYEEKCAIIEKRLQELHELEREKCASMDKAAEPFSRLMEEIMAYSGPGAVEKNESILRWIGYNMGKWIYIIDAFHDLEKDMKARTYNPLLYQFGYSGDDIRSFCESIRGRTEFNLTQALSQIAKAYELLELKINKGIVENIIYMGMLRKTEQILKAGSCRKVEESV